MKRIVTHNLPVMGNSSTVKLSIEERSVELAHYIIESKDRTKAGKTLVPNGLTLMEVNYDKWQ